MSPPLHPRNQTAVEAVGGSWLFNTKDSEVDRICRKGQASVFWYAKGILLIDYHEKGRTIAGKYYSNLLVHLDVKICEN